MKRSVWFRLSLLCSALALAGQAHALAVASVSPQGEVSRVRQVVVKFKADAVAFGDAKLAAPFTLACNDAQAQKGEGRWTGAREWVYDFEDDLPPGTRCTLKAAAGFKAADGSALEGKISYAFHTGGPIVRDVLPGTWRKVDEDQHFVLALNGAATPESVQAHVWCSAEGVGERVPVKLITGADRAALLKELDWSQRDEKKPGTVFVMQCQRRLTPETKVELVYGKGVATPSGIPNTVERRFEYEVRPLFQASMSCERENAQAACMPLRPVTLDFSASAPRRLLQQARLTSDKGEIAPEFNEKGDPDDLLDSLKFPAPLAESATYTLTLPADLKDDSGRPLANAASFPLTVRTSPMPPLAKFAAGTFGIVERFAEGPNGTPLLPVTLRRVEPQLGVQSMQISRARFESDADIIEWMRRVEEFDDASIERKKAAQVVRGTLPPPLKDSPYSENYVETRAISLLEGRADAQTQPLPGAQEGDTRPFEVVGIPLPPGFHVLEIASRQLGQALLNEGYGPQRTMYVRTSALVTNLAVHFKWSPEGSLAWVTTLDHGQPVAGAQVNVSDCYGKPVARAVTDAQGLARLPEVTQSSPCAHEWRVPESTRGYFISARSGEGSGQDMAFVWSNWNRGIEPWRFNAPTGRDGGASAEVAHTVLDRTLVRAGETVSMKHYLRQSVSPEKGTLALPPAGSMPRTLTITHVGSGQEYTQELNWRDTPTGGRSAASQFAVPKNAKLGVYRITLGAGGGDDDGSGSHSAGSFRVEEFRLPVYRGSVAVADENALIATADVPVQVQVSYVAGGAAAHLPVQVSAAVKDIAPHFGDYDSFSFTPPDGRRSSETRVDDDGDDGDAPSSASQKLVADKQPLTLDAQGAGRLVLAKLPASSRPRELLLEATYADPNGEIQTLSQTQTMWPAAVVAGLRADSWVSVDKNLKLQALALDLQGKPKAGAAMTVRAVAHTTTTTRKRLVGGFYAYDHHHETHDLGALCSGKTDARGLLHCDVKLAQPGRIELVASAADEAGRKAEAAQSVWVTRQGELWFDGENNDRMDVLPEQKRYNAGDTARFQVRMPFRKATALVAVEREGIVQTQVVQLSGDDPTISLKVGENWGPNVYVSVLALRGRLYEVPWYSFFTWGFKSPIQWWRAFRNKDGDFAPPTALVDLSKPTYRFGMAEIRVGEQNYRMHVGVEADKASYAPRGTARVRIEAKLPGGQPAAQARVAVAAVDKALLELMPNTSWNLLEAMLRRRSWDVETATAQMEIVGRRHYGRKAAPPGGDGAGGAPVRELLDTLLLWKPDVELDANGQAIVDVPLNDALTTFQIVAVADSGANRFGTGKTSVRVTQDLQIISGLPPLVRGGDAYEAAFTLRNTTDKPMKVQVQAEAAPLQTEAQTLEIPAGQASEARWQVTAPPHMGVPGAQEITWKISAKDENGSASDALKVSQRVVPAVPVTVQQATLVQLEKSYTLPVAPPADALPGRGGLRLALQAKLADGLPAINDWFAAYPYSCLEQQTSKAIGMRDEAQWRSVAAQMPSYMDGDGLLYYFPPRSGQEDKGSPILTAWMLAATHEASRIKPQYALPEDVRQPMLDGLAAFVEGRITRRYWSPRKDLDVLKLAAIEALSRYGAARAAMLESITIAPNQWPVSAVIDWVNVLRRVKGIPAQPQKLEEAMQILRSRLSWQGSRLIFSAEKDDDWWWFMAGGDVNTARLLLTVLDDPEWHDDMGRLINGFIQRQQSGAWHTTTANLWGSFAIEQFARARESAPVSGITRASLGGEKAQVDWSEVRPAPKEEGVDHANSRLSYSGAPASPGLYVNNTMQLPWPQKTGQQTGQPAGKSELAVTHEGSGSPWLTLQSLAAVPLKAPFAAGYQIKRSVTPLEQADKSLPAGHYSRGDILRVTLEVNASADMTWVAITDPVPGGATILGSGLGRDSAIASSGEKSEGWGWLAYEERSFEAFRAYYEYLPKGKLKMEYTVRLNNPGVFNLPPTRVEALYAPEMFGEAPNAPVQVRQ